jgi:hypothetical protein
MIEADSTKTSPVEAPHVQDLIPQILSVRPPAKLKFKHSPKLPDIGKKNL